jgi:hypothetical protein
MNILAGIVLWPVAIVAWMLLAAATFAAAG